MAKELFFYDGFYSWSVQNLVERMQEEGDDKDLTIRMNSGGGSVFAGWGLIAEMQKRQGKTKISIDGNASSMALVTALFADEVTILDTTKALMHRADMYVENDNDRKMLDEINDKMLSAAKNRLKSDVFALRTGKTLDQVYDKGRPQSENEIWLNAEDLVEIGLVSRDNVLTLTTQMAAELKSKAGISMDSYREPEQAVHTEEILNNNNNNNSTTMTNEEIQAQVDAAVKAERSRVANWLVWSKVDSEKVLASIQSGEVITPEQTQEFITKLADTNALNEIENKSANAVETKEVETGKAEEVSNEQKELEAYKATLDASLGLKKEEAK